MARVAMESRCPEESGYCGEASWRSGGAVADDSAQLLSALAVDVAVASGELADPMAAGIPQPPVIGRSAVCDRGATGVVEDIPVS